MQQDRNGRRSNARAAAPSFPESDPHDARAPSPSHADASHIARRRVSSAPAHEVELGEVELIDPAPEPRRPRWAPPPALARFRGRVVPKPVEPPRSSGQLPESGKRPRPKPPPKESRLPLFAKLGLGSVAAFAVVALVMFARTRATSLPPPPIATASSSAPAAAPSVAIPVADVAQLPHSTGTVIGAQGHRLWIDGVLAESWQAPARCGEHVVQVGSAGTPRKVAVPCGEAITVSP